MEQDTKEKNFIGPKEQYEYESLLEFLRQEPVTFILGLAVLILENPFNYLVLAPFYLVSIMVLEMVVLPIESIVYIQKFLNTDECSQVSGDDLQKFEELKKDATEAAKNFLDAASIIQESEDNNSDYVDYMTLPSAEENNSGTTDPLGAINLEDVD